MNLVVRMARDNVSWGYKRIEGALHNIGYTICSSTVANILKQHGIEPAPSRQRTISWSTFLKAHWDAFEGIDLDAIRLWSIDLVSYIVGHVSGGRAIASYAAEAIQDVPHQLPNSIRIGILQVADTETQEARAPPISAGKIPSISFRDIRHAA